MTFLVTKYLSLSFSHSSPNNKNFLINPVFQLFGEGALSNIKVLSEELNNPGIIDVLYYFIVKVKN